MTNRFPLYLLVSLLLAGIFSACNEDVEQTVTLNNNVNCEVSSFSLKRNDSVLTRLDSVYFAIDLVRAEIYNADSLPVGTRTSALLVDVGTESASACNLTYRIHGTDRDTTVNFIDSPNDSINFADGPVMMEIVSRDGSARRTYQVKVNVHKTVPDTLSWDDKNVRKLPTALGGAITAQKTVMFGGKPHCFTTDGRSVSIAVIDDAFAMTYTAKTVAFPSGADVTSVASTSDALYCNDAKGNLYRSADGHAWTATGTKMTYIYGGYGSRLLGALESSGSWKHITYPATDERAVPAGCPVHGTSDIVEFTSKWNISPTAVIVGGRDADGNVTGDAWAYDGTTWGRLSNNPIPAAWGVAMFPYNTPKVDTRTWRVTEQSVLVAMNGLMPGKDGKTVSQDTVYVSRDFGISWSKADASLQLPATMPRVGGADILVIDHTLHATPAARVIAPIEEWECPYIYMFGGFKADGTLVPEVRRGVINRYTFKPIY